MRMFRRVAVTAALLAPMVAGPVEAQNYRWDVGVNGGYSWYRSMMNEEALGIPDASLGFKAGPLVGAQLGFWAAPNIGLRLNGTYADRPLELDGGADVESTDLLGNVNLWSGSLDLLYRFSRPNTDWRGTEILPYLALGLGAKWINAAGSNARCVEGTDGDAGDCSAFPVGTTVYALDDGARLMGLVGLGTDVRLSPNFGLRLELNDRIYKPNLYTGTVGTDGTFALGTETNSRTVHEIAGQIGLHLLMGLQRPAVVSVIPAPAPQPPPVAPTPAPTEETVTVCVVDPTVRSGLRTQTAYYRFAERDTVVMVNGQRVPLNQSVGNVMVVRDADWYVRGQPLTIRVGNERVEYVSYMGARRIEADRLSYLGTVNGYPVYADRDEVADVMVRMNALSDAERNRDLGEILAANRDLRTGLQGVQYLYVPVEPTGCVFQPLQVMEGVSKGK